MENQNILNTVKHIHFIGIGGSGMCPIAEILYHRGYHITGSDISESETVQKIRSYQIPVIIGQKAENIKGADLIVYTAAVKKDNPELVAALESGIPTLERSEMLGVSGLHCRFRNTWKNHYNRYAYTIIYPSRKRSFCYHWRKTPVYRKQWPCRQI